MSLAYFGNCDSSGNLTAQQNVSNNDAGLVQWSSYTCPGSGSQAVGDLGAYVANASGFTGLVRLAIYDSTGTTLLGQGGLITLPYPTSEAWQSNGFPAINLVGGTTYILAISYGAGSGTISTTHADSVINGVYNLTDETGGYPASLPSSIGNFNQYPMRCGVQAAGGAVVDPGVEEHQSLWGRNPFHKPRRGIRRSLADTSPPAPPPPPPVDLGGVYHPLFRRTIFHKPSRAIRASTEGIFVNAYQMPALAGTYTITGDPITALRGLQLSLNPGVYVLTGDATVLNVGRVLSATAGAYLISGDAATLVYTPTGGGFNYSLSLAAGVYTITGDAVTLPVARVLSLAAGAYALTGNPTTDLVARVLNALAGSYILSGKAATTSAGRVFNVAPGTYVLTGDAVGLVKSMHLSAIAGVYVISGRNANLVDSAHVVVKLWNRRRRRP